MLFGAGVVGAFVPSIVGAWIRHGITSGQCWKLALISTLASAWINFLVQYQLCLNGSKSPNWPNLAGAGLILFSPLFGFVAACLILLHPLSLVLKPDSWAISRATLKLFNQDRPLVGAVLATSVFCLVSGIAIQTVNSFGMTQLNCNMLGTSIMTACIGIGIAIGSVLAGKFSHGTTDARVVRWGICGIFATLVLMALSWPSTQSGGSQHLLGFRGSLPVLLVLGAAAGLFAIPLQVFLQSRPPENQKGRMIAAMNLANYVAILLSGVTYGLLDAIVTTLQWPRSSIFGFMSMFILPLLLWYKPNFAPPKPNSETEAFANIRKNPETVV